MHPFVRHLSNLWDALIGLCHLLDICFLVLESRKEIRVQGDSRIDAGLRVRDDAFILHNCIHNVLEITERIREVHALKARIVPLFLVVCLSLEIRRQIDRTEELLDTFRKRCRYMVLVGWLLDHPLDLPHGRFHSFDVRRLPLPLHVVLLMFPESVRHRCTVEVCSLQLFVELRFFCDVILDSQVIRSIPLLQKRQVTVVSRFQCRTRSLQFSRRCNPEIDNRAMVGIHVLFSRILVRFVEECLQDPLAERVGRLVIVLRVIRRTTLKDRATVIPYVHDLLHGVDVVHLIRIQREVVRELLLQLSIDICTGVLHVFRIRRELDLLEVPLPESVKAFRLDVMDIGSRNIDNRVPERFLKAAPPFFLLCILDHRVIEDLAADRCCRIGKLASVCIL